MKQKKTSKWALASVGFGFAAAILLLLSGYGYQWSWWGLGTAFSWLLPASGILGIIGLSLAVVFGFSRWRNPAKEGANLAFLAVVLCVAVTGTLGYWYNEAQQYPPIHDISTDIENPPEFRDIVHLRADASNDTTYGDQEKAEIQREHYPDIQTLYLDVDYDEAFDRALQAAEQRPWEQIVTADKEKGIIEAVDKLPWFGFIDDVVIHVDTSNTSGRSKIDVRSVSRIGRGDLGVNAQRIRDYTNEIKSR